MQRVPGFLAIYGRLINKSSIIIKTKKNSGGGGRGGEGKTIGGPGKKKRYSMKFDHKFSVSEDSP